MAGFSIAAIRASISATSMSTATWVRFCGLTKVRMFVTPSGPKTSSRLGEASQWSVSFTSWCPMTVGMKAPLGGGCAGVLTDQREQQLAMGDSGAPADNSAQLSVAASDGDRPALASGSRQREVAGRLRAGYVRAVA